MSVPSIITIPKKALVNLSLQLSGDVHYQLPPQELIKQTIARGEGVLNDTKALVINTGKFTGRSPKDKFIVIDSITKDTVDWNIINQPIDEKYFFILKDKMLSYLQQKEIWVRDCFACAADKYKLKLRVFNEQPSANLFCFNMFINPSNDELENFSPEWQIIQAPFFKANPITDGTRDENFSVISFTHKTILIGGTGYTGEMKKGVFTILNFLLPKYNQVLSMHCSTNMGKEGDTAIFFGLSGTGKTTLSADPQRFLIGDDEHGWDDEIVFNFEGGCYAKCIDLNEEKEPEIFNAIKPGALVENITFIDGTNKIDFKSKRITENTRVSYPLNFISNAIIPSIGYNPKNIFFLTCDANGVLPPISKLNTSQTMYQFISGYTAKVAGTEAGVTEPKSTFSACFGAPFFPLHPGAYADLLGKKINKHKVNVWMINTGWIGGPYGIGQRISLKYTRAMINAALNGSLDNEEYETTDWFNLSIPKKCPDVPSEILNAKNTWASATAFDKKAKALANEFVKNFEQYKSGVSAEILSAAPKIN